MGGRGSSSGAKASNSLSKIMETVRTKNAEFAKIRENAKKLLRELESKNATASMINSTKKLIRDSRPIKNFNDPRL